PLFPRRTLIKSFAVMVALTLVTPSDSAVATRRPDSRWIAPPEVATTLQPFREWFVLVRSGEVTVDTVYAGMLSPAAGAVWFSSGCESSRAPVKYNAPAVVNWRPSQPDTILALCGIATTEGTAYMVARIK